MLRRLRDDLKARKHTNACILSYLLLPFFLCDFYIPLSQRIHEKVNNIDVRPWTALRYTSMVVATAMPMILANERLLITHTRPETRGCPHEASVLKLGWFRLHIFEKPPFRSVVSHWLNLFIVKLWISFLHFKNVCSRIQHTKRFGSLLFNNYSVTALGSGLGDARCWEKKILTRACRPNFRLTSWLSVI